MASFWLDHYFNFYLYVFLFGHLFSNSMKENKNYSFIKNIVNLAKTIHTGRKLKSHWT